MLRHGGCLAVYTTVAVAGAVVAKHLASLDLRVIYPLAVLLLTAALVIVWFRAPVMHPDSPKSPSTLARFKVRGRIVAAVELALVTLIMPMAPCLAAAVLGGSIGGFLSACTLLFPVSGRKGGIQG